MAKQYLSNILVDTFTLPDGSTLIQVMPYAGTLITDGQQTSIPTGGVAIAAFGFTGAQIAAATWMRVCVENQNARYRVRSGNAATNAIGAMIPAGGCIDIYGSTNIANFTIAAVSQTISVFIQLFG